MIVLDDDGSSISELSKTVIDVMSDIEEFNKFDLSDLASINIGVLRSDSTRKHAVCRYKKGVRKDRRRGPIDVSRIDLHPFVLSKRWQNYARYLLFHEYIHALGFSNHGSSFRALDSKWPYSDDRDLGKRFYLYLLNINGKWIWRCRKCDFYSLRTVRCNGRYLCGKCMSVLIDVPNHLGSKEAQDFGVSLT